jgi:hypothetical protein
MVHIMRILLGTKKNCKNLDQGNAFLYHVSFSVRTMLCKVL